MRIDCHCHLFDNACVPVMGFLAGRLGLAIGDRVADILRDLKQGKSHLTLLDYFSDVMFDPETFLGNIGDVDDKNSLAFIMKHPEDFFGFLGIGILDIPQILDKYHRKASAMDILVPLMMDMTHAYPGSLPETGFEAQCDIMSRLTLRARGRVMPFYAFDPRAENALDKAKAAIESRGFIGIKLYPPLGFKPMGNADERVEQNLLGLYAFCSNDRSDPIPITSHCSWSAGVYSNRKIDHDGLKAFYRSLAAPVYWGPVLAEFPNLKINLAHFGGLGEWEALSKGEKPEKEWIDPIIGFMKTHDHVYTDLSYNYLPTTRHAESYKRILLQKIHGVEHRVVFGTDYYMSRMLCDLDEFVAAYQDLLRDVFDRAAGENAIHFLRSEASKTFSPRFFERNHAVLDPKYVGLFD